MERVTSIGDSQRGLNIWVTGISEDEKPKQGNRKLKTVFPENIPEILKNSNLKLQFEKVHCVPGDTDPK